MTSKIIAKTGTINGLSLYNESTSEEIANRLEEFESKLFGKKKANKLYFAGPWFSEKSKIIYDYCVNISYNNRVNYVFTEIFFPALNKLTLPNEVFNNNIEMLNNCNEMIAFISEKDVGTALEIGYFLAKNKPITLLVYDKSDLLSKTNLMLSRAARCIELKDITKFLSGTLSENDFIKINNDWNGVE